MSIATPNFFLWQKGFFMNFYTRIENLRKSKGISQGALEKELGFSNGSVSKWKNSMPTPERLKKLADYFQVTVDYLVTGNSNPTLSLPSLDAENASTAQQIYIHDKVLFDVYRSADKERLVAYAQKLKELRDLEDN